MTRTVASKFHMELKRIRMLKRVPEGIRLYISILKLYEIHICMYTQLFPE